MGRLETRTEDMFKDLCVKMGYTKENGITVDRQTCSLAEINNLLAHASKTEGSDRAGYPDFIITNKTYPGIVILVECKASTSDHEQAIHEVFGYAQNLMGLYDIVIVAASGTTETEFKIDTGIIRKDGSTIAGQTQGYNAKILLPLSDYEKWIGYTKRVEQDILTEVDAMKTIINEVLFASGNPGSFKRMLLLSACMLALRDNVFRKTFGQYQDIDILDETLKTAEKVLKRYGIPITKLNTMMYNFNLLQQNTAFYGQVELKDGTITNPVKYMLHTIHTSKVHDELENATLNIDIMGRFYNEFITHHNGDGDAKGGFVLTPHHICELFADLGELNETTKVLDMCFGTGGFLVSAMQKEIIAAKGDQQKIQNIKNNNICGVELDGDRFTYGCVNMILRGDGQSNMLNGDCFDTQIVSSIKSKKCNVGFINPPYAQPINELRFVENMLDCLDVGGRGIAIIPSSCTGNKNGDYAATRERILSKHTLEAVLSMPDQLFYPVGTVTCIMIFTAHKPHNSTRKTWFASCKDDGLVIKKKLGRVDEKGLWESIKKQWVDAFINRDEIKGFSLKQTVTAKDEWSYEAYAKTDFEGITEESFKKVIKDYALFLLGQADI